MQQDITDPASLTQFTYRGKPITFFLPDYGTDLVQRSMHNSRAFFEDDFLTRVLKYIPERPVVVDAGANVGSMSVWFAKCAGATKVYAFEPSDIVFGVLEKNIALNGLSDIVYPRKCILGASQGVGGLCYDMKGNIGAAMYRKTDSGTGSIEVVTIDDAVTGRVDVLKVDVEGYQVPVLQGASRTLREYHPLILVEIFARDATTVDPAYDSAGNYSKTFELLYGLGYRLETRVGNDYVFI